MAHHVNVGSLYDSSSAGQPRDMAMSAIEYMKSKIAGLIEVYFIEPKKIVSDDRDVLENIILPHFGRDEFFQRILFVGCSAYTQWYEQIFSTREYWTIDSKDIKQRYGSKRHIVDSIVNLEKHFAEHYFHLMIMNGVIGFGLDQASDIETALEACYQRLDANGVLVLGWNDTMKRMPIDLAAIQALKKWHEYYFVPLQACHVRTAGRYGHVFSFYTKGPGRRPCPPTDVGEERSMDEGRC
jgi:hypothetical protein